MQLTNDLLLVEFDSAFLSKIGSLYIDPTYEPEVYQSVVGKVIATGPASTTEKHNTIIPAIYQPGDIVVVDYLAAQTAMGNGVNNHSAGSVIFENVVTFPAGQVLFYVRNGELRSAPGRVLARSIHYNSNLYFGDTEEKQIFEVVHCGEPAIRSWNEAAHVDLKPGDIIATDQYCNWHAEGGIPVYGHELITVENCLVVAVLDSQYLPEGRLSTSV